MLKDAWQAGRSKARRETLDTRRDRDCPLTGGEGETGNCTQARGR